MPNNSVDAVVTDPPYGFSFMGKKWDYQVPSKEIWSECLRILKPGGHLLAFGGPRTYHRLACNVEDAGFEIRDQLQWLFGSGFPKSHNLKDQKGWGSALKPANEPIVLARKPLSEKTLALNVKKWGTGALNIDGCRIEGAPNPASWNSQRVINDSDGRIGQKKKWIEASNAGLIKPPSGRWPANVLLDETAAEMLDEQSGKLKFSYATNEGNASSIFGSAMGSKKNVVNKDRQNDSGGASRFFYVAKTSKRERNAGLEGMPGKIAGIIGDDLPDGKNQTIPNQNHHPTVKPIKLIEHLCALITPPKGVILDPFMGSGTTGIAAKNLGFDFIGIEMNEEYMEIAKRRILSAE